MIIWITLKPSSLLRGAIDFLFLLDFYSISRFSHFNNNALIFFQLIHLQNHPLFLSTNRNENTCPGAESIKTFAEERDVNICANQIARGE